ncbi:hypothetical protein BKA82DRAFT_32193 [Pisolithus tinctorius]|uniref:Uncharacterized protein n=1 Tax=Pisolithus tinctorius Marx 270 TaxID=870435 RepID=A0A0C3NPS9_PISTI|nr:hypothetical protein BKA82DRAFT_32193 [Pisolithus tinctorius]KIN97580.1 hypothetical protein M404DRAFT_32193 [Pisolithus tinctorius Marx 270]
MSQQAETSQTTAATSPVALPHEIVANAADIVMAELLTLHDHRNKQYWQKAMHIIWEQLTRVRPLVEELPSKFTIPTHIIAAEMVMRDPVVLMVVKEWPDFDKIRDTTDADVVDHPWYQIGWPVNKGKGHTVPLEPLQISDTAPTAAETLEEPHGRSTSRAAPTGTRPRSRRPPKRTRSVAASDVDVSTVTAGASAGHGRLIAALATPAAGYIPIAKEDRCDRCTEKNLPCAVKPGSACWQCSCQKYRCSIFAGVKAARSQSRQPRSRAVTEASDGAVERPQTVAANRPSSQHRPQSPSPRPSATISSEPTTPVRQTHKRCAATRGMTPATGKATTSAAASSCRQIFDGVVIVTPSWRQSGRQTSSLASRRAATSQSRLTTPSCPVTPNATPMERMEEEIAALRQQHMETVQDLLDTCHELADTQWALADTQTELQTLADVVKALWQRLYPLPHSSPDAPGPSHPSAVGFAITSHQAVIPTDGARILDLAPTTMVQEVAINTSILQSLPGDMLLAPSTFLPPTHHFPYPSTTGVGEAPPPIYVSLGAVANDAGGDDSNDQNAANWMDVD